MTPVIRTAARAVAISLLLGFAIALPAAAQRVQDVAPLPAPAAAAPSLEPAGPPAAVPAAETTGPRIRAEFRRADAAPPVVVRKDGMNTITISTLALVLAVVVLVLLIK